MVMCIYVCVCVCVCDGGVNHTSTWNGFRAMRMAWAALSGATCRGGMYSSNTALTCPASATTCANVSKTGRVLVTEGSHGLSDTAPDLAAKIIHNQRNQRIQKGDERF